MKRRVGIWDRKNISGECRVANFLRGAGKNSARYMMPVSYEVSF